VRACADASGAIFTVAFLALNAPTNASRSADESALTVVDWTSRCSSRSLASATCSRSPSRPRSETSAGSPHRASSLPTPAWRRASTSPASGPRAAPALEGRLQDAALGRRRSRPARLARIEPVARPVHRSLHAQNQERRQVSRRAKSPDRCLAHALPPTTVQAEPPPRRPQHCPGKSVSVLAA
jgi:hypothetical protein